MMPEKKEFPHVFEIRLREPFSKLLRQPGRKLPQQLGAIPGPLLSPLLMLHYAPADLEVREHLERVDSAGSSVAGGLDEVANLGDERSKVIGPRLHQNRSFRGGGFLFHPFRARMSCAGKAFGVAGISARSFSDYSSQSSGRQEFTKRSTSASSG